MYLEKHQFSKIEFLPPLLPLNTRMCVVIEIGMSFSSFPILYNFPNLSCTVVCMFCIAVIYSYSHLWCCFLVRCINYIKISLDNFHYLTCTKCIEIVLSYLLNSLHVLKTLREPTNYKIDAIIVLFCTRWI